METPDLNRCHNSKGPRKWETQKAWRSCTAGAGVSLTQCPAQASARSAPSLPARCPKLDPFRPHCPLTREGVSPPRCLTHPELGLGKHFPASRGLSLQGTQAGHRSPGALPRGTCPPGPQAHPCRLREPALPDPGGVVWGGPWEREARA